MNVSMEISMYPLADTYIPAIQAFIDELASRPDLKVITNTMSTQIFGELDKVMEALHEGVRKSWSNSDDKAVFAIKLINSDLRP